MLDWHNGKSAICQVLQYADMECLFTCFYTGVMIHSKLLVSHISTLGIDALTSYLDGFVCFKFFWNNSKEICVKVVYNSFSNVEQSQCVCVCVVCWYVCLFLWLFVYTNMWKILFMQAHTKVMKAQIYI